MSNVTQQKLKDSLVYNENTGDFYKKEKIGSRGRKIGGFKVGYIMTAGRYAEKKYISIGFECKNYLAHRLAWLYVYGFIPDGEIDHIDGNGLNNSLSNLRLASRTENARNVKIYRNNKSGYKGIFFHKSSNKWRARIMADRKAYHLGLFETKELAYNAYCKKAIELHKDFARF